MTLHAALRQVCVAEVGAGGGGAGPADACDRRDFCHPGKHVHRVEGFTFLEHRVQVSCRLGTFSHAGIALPVHCLGAAAFQGATLGCEP